MDADSPTVTADTRPPAIPVAATVDPARKVSELRAALAARGVETGGLLENLVEVLMSTATQSSAAAVDPAAAAAAQSSASPVAIASSVAPSSAASSPLPVREASPLQRSISGSATTAASLSAADSEKSAPVLLADIPLSGSGRVKAAEMLDEYEREGKENLRRARKKLLDGGLLPMSSADAASYAEKLAAADVDGATAGSLDATGDDDDKFEVPQYSCCVGTGCFCSKRGALCFRSTSGLADMGVGVSLYFKVVKFIATLFVIFSAILAYEATRNYWASAGAADAIVFPIVFTTVATLQPYNGTAIANSFTGETSSAHHIASVYAWLDLACTVVFVISIIWVWRFLDKEQESVDKYTLTIQDYAVMISQVPRATTEQDVREWVQRVLVDVPEAQLDVDALAEKINAESSKGDNALPRKNVVAVSAERNEMLKSVFALSHVTLVPDQSKVLPLLHQVAAAKREVALIQGAIKARALRRAEGCWPCGSIWTDLKPIVLSFRPDLILPLVFCCCFSRESRDPLARAAREAAREATRVVAEVDAAMNDLFERQKRALGDNAALGDNPFAPVAAFVIFEHQEAKDTFNALCPDDAVSVTCQPCCAPKRMLHVKATNEHSRTTVREAPMPSTIQWGNVHVSTCYRTLLFVVVLCVLLVAVGVLFALLFALQREVQKDRTSLERADCTDVTLSAFVTTYKSRATPQDTAAILDSMPTTNQVLFCLCKARGFATMTVNEVLSDAFYDRCPYQVCPRLKGLGHSSVPAMCDFIDQTASSIGYKGLIIGAVMPGINFGLSMLVPWVVSLQMHVSSEHADGLVATIMFLGLFFNSAVVIVLVNYLFGGYRDLTQGWYSNVGLPIVWAMIYQIITPHVLTLMPLLAGFCGGFRFSGGASFKDNTSEIAQREALIGAKFNFATRLATVFNHMFTCFLFSPGMPILAPIAAFGAFVSYWIDKVSLLRVSRRPPFTSKALIEGQLYILPLAVILQAMMATWVLARIWNSYDDSALRLLPAPLNVTSYLARVLKPAGSGPEAFYPPTNVFPLATSAAAAAASTLATFAAVVRTAALSSQPAALPSALWAPRALATVEDSTNCSCIGPCVDVSEFMSEAALASDFAPLFVGITACSVDSQACPSAPVAAAGGRFSTCPAAPPVAAVAAVNNTVACGCVTQCSDVLSSVARGLATCLVPSSCLAPSAHASLTGYGAALFSWTPCNATGSDVPLDAPTSDLGCVCTSRCADAPRASATTPRRCLVDYDACPFATLPSKGGEALAYDTCGNSPTVALLLSDVSSQGLRCLYNWPAEVCALSSVDFGAPAAFAKIYFGGVGDVTKREALEQVSFLWEPTLLAAIKTSGNSISANGLQFAPLLDSGVLPMFVAFTSCVVFFVFLSVSSLCGFEMCGGKARRLDFAVNPEAKTVPFSRAVRGEKAAYRGVQLPLIDRTYEIHAQERFILESGFDILQGSHSPIKASNPASDRIIDTSIGLACLVQPRYIINPRQRDNLQIRIMSPVAMAWPTPPTSDVSSSPVPDGHTPWGKLVAAVAAVTTAIGEEDEDGDDSEEDGDGSKEDGDGSGSEDSDDSGEEDSDNSDSDSSDSEQEEEAEDEM